MSDEALLRTILSNILENAARYSREDKNSFLQINFKKLASSLSIQIIDNGRGISENVRDKVFTMFFRADNVRSGVGLGLYLAKIALHKLKGSISYEHTVRNETLFELRVPYDITLQERKLTKFTETGKD